MAEEDVEPRDWAGGISAKGQMRALMPTPDVRTPTLTEGQALKMAIQSYPFGEDQQLQALLSMPDDEVVAALERLERETDVALGAINPAYLALLRAR